MCVHCLKENVACTQNGQCCEGQCTYGRCKAGVSEGQPGTFCDRHEDCAGEGKAACCVRLVAIHLIKIEVLVNLLNCLAMLHASSGFHCDLIVIIKNICVK